MTAEQPSFVGRTHATFAACGPKNIDREQFGEESQYDPLLIRQNLDDSSWSGSRASLNVQWG